MITLTRKDADTWVLTSTDLMLEVSREDLRQVAAKLKNAHRLPVPSPPPPVVEVPVLPAPPDALALAVSALGLPAVLDLLLKGKTPAEVQALLKDRLPVVKP